MVRLIFHPEAKAELRESASFYEDEQEGLGKKFLTEVRSSLDKVQEFPFRYPLIAPDFRSCRVSRFPYGVIYRKDPDEIFIIAVMHYRRKPGYWQNR